LGSILQIIIESSGKSISFIISDLIRVAVVQFMIWIFYPGFSALPAPELFLFSGILEENRTKLIKEKSFLLTVIKDKENQENRFRRINVRKIS